jgi:hypothetical protein
MKKQNKQTDKFKKITIIFGYALFALLVIAVTISTVIPFGSMLFNPAVRHLNVTVLLISLVAGAVLPPLVSYLIGDRATHSKAKLDHHFNGVLFGIASYWLSLFFFFIGSDAISNIRGKFAEPLATAITSWPILAALVILVAVAVGYVKSRKKGVSVLEYKPFQITLFVGMIANFMYVLSHQSYGSDMMWVVSLLYVIVPVVLILISYLALPTRLYNSSFARLTGAVVAVSVGFIASSVTGQLLPYNEAMYAPIAVGVATVILYVMLVRRSK